MSTNELRLNISPQINSPGDRILGLLGLLAVASAPMLIAQFLIGGEGILSNSTWAAALGILYIGGWMCGAVGMFRQKAYGRTPAAKIVFTIQMILLTLALLFSVQETMGVSYDNGGGIFFGICDAGYPLSHLFMFVIGILTIRARIWKGAVKAAPLLVGAALPVTMLGGPVLGMLGGMLIFGGLVTIGLGIIGLKIFIHREHPLI